MNSTPTDLAGTDEFQTTVSLMKDFSVAGVLDGMRENGAVVLRNPGHSADDFENMCDALMTAIVHQATGTLERDVVRDDGKTSTVNLGQDAIPFHREGSYAPNSPQLLALYCIHPAAAGGQTVLCDGAKLREALPEDIRAFVDTARLCWSWDAPPDRWQPALGAKTVEQAKQAVSYLQKNLPSDESLEGEFSGEILKGTYQVPCVVTSKLSNRKSFSNSLLIHHYRAASSLFRKDLFHATLGDGSSFPLDTLAQIYDYSQRIQYVTGWQQGDILMFDNVRMMHGREAFEDPERRILIKMGHWRPEII